MRILLRISLLIILPVIISFILTKSSFASDILFQDNFDEGNSNNWTLASNNCTFNGQPAQWEIKSKSDNILDKKIGMVSNGGGCFSILVPNDSAWNFNNKNYAVDFDIELVQGSDYAFLFRYNDESNLNGIHIQSPNDIVLQRVEDSSDTTAISYGNYSNEADMS